LSETPSLAPEKAAALVRGSRDARPKEARKSAAGEDGKAAKWADLTAKK